MRNGNKPWNPIWRRLLGEPVVHFFCIGALLFLVQRWVAGNPRTITVTPGVKAGVERRLKDRKGQQPTPAELEAELRTWKRDEALFREALREHLDRDDADVRNVLVSKMRMRATLEVPKREPTEAELNDWLMSHRRLYETPRTYDFEYLAFPKAEPNASTQLEQFERKINEGANPAMLGRPVIGGNLAATDMKDRIDPELAEHIPSLPIGPWQRIETKESLFLARVKQILGGLPSLEQIRSQVTADWSLAMQEQAIERILQRTVDRYRFEERS